MEASKDPEQAHRALSHGTLPSTSLKGPKSALLKSRVNRPEWQKDCGVNLPPHGGSLGTERNELIPVSKDFVTVVGATGQQEKVFFLKPINFKDLHLVVANPYTLLTKLQVWFTVFDLKDAFFCLPLTKESQNVFAFEWESPTTGRKTQLTWTVLPQGFKNSPTIFGNQLARELETWDPPSRDGTLLHLSTESSDGATASNLPWIRAIWRTTRIRNGVKRSHLQNPPPSNSKGTQDLLGNGRLVSIMDLQLCTIYNIQPLDELLKNNPTQLIWSREAPNAFKTLQKERMKAPALGLPDVTKPFWLFSHEKQGTAWDWDSTKELKLRVARVPTSCGSCTTKYPRRLEIYLRPKNHSAGFTHSISRILEQKGNHRLSPSRFLQYQALLVEPDDVNIEVTNVTNPASFLSGVTSESLIHDCLETIETVYSSRPDVTEEPLVDAQDSWFTDGSSFVRQGIRKAGYTVTTASKVIESQSLPAGTLAQKAEIIALTRTLELAKRRKINIWTDSKYAFGVVHAHGAIWKERGLLTARGRQIKHAEEILHL
ncbi:hypothetical protein QYF61_016866 [Mycteria americana]|uniref:ribonuclease H n=1 Tax=Mycteria americana TaxID=33587 RepID=A0AAN7S3Q9_MYCAM|nr:hypothetical protein QYF61_016866 [Mycteria americana]